MPNFSCPTLYFVRALFLCGGRREGGIAWSDGLGRAGLEGGEEDLRQGERGRDTKEVFVENIELLLLYRQKNMENAGSVEIMKSQLSVPIGYCNRFFGIHCKNILACALTRLLLDLARSWHPLGRLT